MGNKCASVEYQTRRTKVIERERKRERKRETRREWRGKTKTYIRIVSISVPGIFER